MYRVKASTIITHLVGWLIFLSLPLLFVSGSGGNGNVLATLMTADHLLFYSCYIFLFYFNAWVLMPYLYLRKKYILYFAIILLLLVIVTCLRPFDHLMMRSFDLHRGQMDPSLAHYHMPFGSRPPGNSLPGSLGSTPPSPPGDRPAGDRPPRGRPLARFDAVSIFLFVMILALSITVKISALLQKTQQRVVRAEADKANAELSFLKAQINPHFLFNTLNNIYSLAITRSEYTADSIMKLSNIMRYVTDDITEDYVSLQSEIDCISDYIDLQRLRLGKNSCIDFEVSGEPERAKIAPLVLMPFVENAFKYGISKHEESPVDIKLAAGQQYIHFFCSNKIYQANKRIERTGIGISNTRQRLQHLYPGKHILNIATENNHYTIDLTLIVNQQTTWK